jgi:hypothetical protein
MDSARIHFALFTHYKTSHMLTPHIKSNGMIPGDQKLQAQCSLWENNFSADVKI